VLFNSHIFILCFLPGTLAVYFLVNRYLPSRIGRYVLIAASLAFALYADMISACVLIGSVGINFWLSRHVAHSPVKKAVLLAGVVFNIGLLAVFKYSNTVFEGIEDWVGSETILRIALPLGISFYTFQQIAYLVDIYKGSVEPAPLATTYWLSLSFLSWPRGRFVPAVVWLHSLRIPQEKALIGKDSPEHCFCLLWVLPKK
jgi:alginate O-acetyltransferase complex protein AlgI